MRINKERINTISQEMKLINVRFKDQEKTILDHRRILKNDLADELIRFQPKIDAVYPHLEEVREHLQKCLKN